MRRGSAFGREALSDTASRRSVREPCLPDIGVAGRAAGPRSPGHRAGTKTGPTASKSTLSVRDKASVGQNAFEAASPPKAGETSEDPRLLSNVAQHHRPRCKRDALATPPGMCRTPSPPGHPVLALSLVKPCGGRRRIGATPFRVFRTEAQARPSAPPRRNAPSGTVAAALREALGCLQVFPRGVRSGRTGLEVSGQATPRRTVPGGLKHRRGSFPVIVDNRDRPPLCGAARRAPRRSRGIPSTGAPPCRRAGATCRSRLRAP